LTGKGCVALRGGRLLVSSQHVADGLLVFGKVLVYDRQRKGAQDARVALSLEEKRVVCRGIWDGCLTVIGTGNRRKILRI
jgi:hypothetical protein